jgi:protein SCO1/2
VAERTRRLRSLVVAAVLTAVTLTACASPDVPQEGYAGTEVPSWPVPDTSLRSTEGSSYSFTEDADEPVTLVFFGYTNCPDICSMVLANVTQALQRVGEKADQVELVFVTTDPARDDEATMQRYLSAFDEDYIGLTGRMADIEELAAGFHIFFEKGQKLPGGGYEMLHDDNVFVVDDDGTIPLFWRRTLSPVEMAHDLEQLIPEG